jgi:hypothetical protein
MASKLANEILKAGQQQASRPRSTSSRACRRTTSTAARLAVKAKRHAGTSEVGDCADVDGGFAGHAVILATVSRESQPD